MERGQALSTDTGYHRAVFVHEVSHCNPRGRHTLRHLFIAYSTPILPSGRYYVEEALSTIEALVHWLR